MARKPFIARVLSQSAKNTKRASAKRKTTSKKGTGAKFIKAKKR